MGLNLFSCSSSGDPVTPSTQAPDPEDFTIRRIERVGICCIVHVHYPRCANYQGNKLLLYRGWSEEEILSQKRLDPHFDSNPVVSPFARFEPSFEGHQAALLLAKVYGHSGV